MADIDVGSKAPEFSLASSDGTTVALAALRGKRVVLYFYPKDDTPGCTVEAKSFRDHMPKFEKAGVVVLGVSKDGVESHCRFRDKHKLNFPLLADVGLGTIKSYGAWGEKTMYGRKIMGVVRSTFLIGTDGLVERLWRHVKVDGHVDAILDAVRGETKRPAKVATAAKPAVKKTATASKRATKRS